MYRIVLALGAAGVFAFLCRDSADRLAEAYPSVWMCMEHPEKYEGRHVWISPSPVTSTAPSSFEVIHYGDRIRVHSRLLPNVGAWVMVHGTFQIDGSVESISWVEDNGYSLKRKGVLIVSLVALIAVALIFHKTFEWRDGAIHPR